jgi:hypothetical protein
VDILAPESAALSWL